METKEQKDSGEDSPRGGVVGLGAAAGIEHEEGSPLKNANLTADICVECGEPSNFPCYKCGCGSLYCGNTADNGCWIFQRSKWEGALGEDSSKINWLVEKYPDGVCYECAIDALGDEADDSSGEDDEDSSGSENDDDSGSGDSSFVPGTESEPESEPESNSGDDSTVYLSGGEGDDSTVEAEQTNYLPLSKLVNVGALGAGMAHGGHPIEQFLTGNAQALERNNRRRIYSLVECDADGFGAWVNEGERVLLPEHRFLEDVVGIISKVYIDDAWDSAKEEWMENGGDTIEYHKLLSFDGDLTFGSVGEALYNEFHKIVCCHLLEDLCSPCTIVQALARGYIARARIKRASGLDD